MIKTIKYIGVTVGAILLIAINCYLFCPKPELLEHYNFSHAVYDKNGKLLNLGLSIDEKYRLFTPYEKLNENTKNTLLLYEDKRFFQHFGVDVFSVFRAIKEMLIGGRKQGASTLTMQVARLRWRLNTASISGKIIQILRAIQLERHYSKEQILEAYFNLCPLGGNIEGIGAASLIYFNTNAENLTIPQSAALTVIPQNPEKRNPLKPQGVTEIHLAVQRLKKLWENAFDSYDSGIFEMPISFEKNLPKIAMHTVRRLNKQFNQNRIISTLDAYWQIRLEKITANYINKQKNVGVNNAAVLILNYKTMDVLAETGSADFFNKDISGQVDGLTARRSPGSTLKPFIYALGLEHGLIHPLSLLKDIPENYGLYTPENFDYAFKGLINATDALVQSRNIPAVELLLRLNDDSFYTLLKRAGVPRLKDAKHYGLALALGGAEVTMQNEAELYAMLANLGQYRKLNYIYSPHENKPLSLLTPESAYLVLEMLKTNPAIDRYMLPYMTRHDDYQVRWKTGTSFGFRDAWSVGIAGDYVFVVWLGNFDNSPNNALTGRTMAAPLMFSLIRTMAAEGLIQEPTYPLEKLNLTEVEICLATGEQANAACQKRGKTYFIPNITQTPYSNITRQIPIDIQSGKRACRHLPPQTELRYYQFWPSEIYKIYDKAGIQLEQPPAFLHDCEQIDTGVVGKPPLIKQPTDGSTLIAHGKNDKMSLYAEADADVDYIFWYINDVFVGKSFPDESVVTPILLGKAVIKAVDNFGRVATVSVEGKKFLPDF